jgi:hypothetical protein
MMAVIAHCGSLSQKKQNMESIEKRKFEIWGFLK